MTVSESRQRPDIPTLTESLPLSEAELDAALVRARATLPADPVRSPLGAAPPAAAAAPLANVDIELPFKVRADDATRRRDAAVAAAARASAPQIATPFAPLLDRLLDAGHGPFGLQVDVKHDHRVVGSWEIEIGPSESADVHGSQARAVLNACVAADGSVRATAAFLVLHRWWVTSADPFQFDQLYEGLTHAVLDRFEWLMEDRADLARTMPPYVVYLVDGRQKKLRVFKAARLEQSLLRALGDGRAVPGLDLHVAHGRGTGVSPLSATLPDDLGGADRTSSELDPSDGESTGRATKKPPTEPVRRRADEVFVPERLSQANLRWMRKGSSEPQ